MVCVVMRSEGFLEMERGVDSVECEVHCEALSSSSEEWQDIPVGAFDLLVQLCFREWCLPTAVLCPAAVKISSI